MAVADDSQTTKTPKVVESSDVPKVSPQTPIQKMIADEVHKALSEAGRDAASLERKKAEAAQLLEQAQKERQEVDKLRREQEQQELERYSNDPEGLEIVKARQRQRNKDEEIRRREEDLALRESRIKESEAKYKDSELKILVSAMVAKYPGVSAEDLLTFTDGTLEKMEALAKKLASPATRLSSLRINSGLSSGGSSMDIKELRKQFIANPYNPEIRAAMEKADRERERAKLY